MSFFGLFGKKDKPSNQQTASQANTQTATPPVNNTLNLDKPGRLNLMKGRADLVKELCLRKGFDQKSRVAFVVDYSISMDKLYSSGKVQALFERLFPIAMQFDDDQAIDLFAFHNTSIPIGEVTLDTFHGCIKRLIEDRYEMSGTSYAPIINDIVKWFKKGDTKIPAYVIFITDGDCGDPRDAERALKDASYHGIFFQTVGIGNASFSFLERMDTMDGRKVDNANFFQANDLDKMSDKELYGKMMFEYPSYIKEAKRLNIF